MQSNFNIGTPLGPQNSIRYRGIGYIEVLLKLPCSASKTCSMVWNRPQSVSRGWCWENKEPKDNILETIIFI